MQGTKDAVNEFLSLGPRMCTDEVDVARGQADALAVEDVRLDYTLE